MKMQSKQERQEPIAFVGYILRMWEGRVSLSAMFWLWGVFVSIFYRGLIISIEMNSADPKFWQLFIPLIFFAFRAFWLVGFWRSASNWSKNHSGDLMTDCGVIAKGWVILAIGVALIQNLT
jgi:hypothetical protein